MTEVEEVDVQLDVEKIEVEDPNLQEKSPSIYELTNPTSVKEDIQLKIEELKGLSTPTKMTADLERFEPRTPIRGYIQTSCFSSQIPENIKEQLIVELYSK
jgi:hypothetical protein